MPLVRDFLASGREADETAASTRMLVSEGLVFPKRPAPPRVGGWIAICHSFSERKETLSYEQERTR